MGLRARCRRGIALATVLILAAGCSYGADEPGLFGRDPPTPTDTSSPGTRRSAVQNPDLPVVGDEVWTSADGRAVTVRLAVHAVRRLERATVLDWSVTVLSAPGLAADALVQRVDLGLRTPAGFGIRLVDPRRREVLLPLTRRTDDGARCLCTDPDSAEQNLRVGETSLQQLTFPRLPPTTVTVDVVLPTLPVFSRVPVTPVGEVPIATSPVDLDWEPDPPPAAVWAPERRFTYATGQRFAVSASRVVAGPTATSVEWRIQALTSGPGLLVAPRAPLADPELAPGATATTLRIGSRSLGVLRYGSSASDVHGALATPYGSWISALRSAGQEASVITNVPALPNGQQQVTVVWPGLPGQAFPVLRAPDRSTRSTSRVPPRPVRGWSSDDGTAPASAATEWPTPVPLGRMLADYREIREPLRR